jgi:hypothetical protein
MFSSSDDQIANEENKIICNGCIENNIAKLSCGHTRIV